MIKFNNVNLFIDLRLKMFALLTFVPFLLLLVGIFFNILNIYYVIFIILLTGSLSVLLLTKPVRKLKSLYRNLPLVNHRKYKDYLENTDVDDLYIVDEVDLVNYRMSAVVQHLSTDNFNVIDKPIETTSDKDHLTQMYNRQTLEVKINELIRKSNKNNVESTLILVDIDKFSELNYSYGHSVGDQLIVHVSEIIEHCLKNKSYNKNHDIEYSCGRLSGDEFGIFLYDIDINKISNFIQALYSELSNIKYSNANNELSLSCSLGVAMYPDHGKFFSELLTSSTMALKYSKETNNNKFTFFDAPDADFSSIKNRLYWNEISKNGIDNNILNVYFQPIAKVQPLENGIDISHYECLLRIKENNNWVSPYQYILACERNGNITNIDYFMINEVFKHVAILSSKGLLENLRFSINISGMTFTKDDFCSYIESKTKEHNISSDSIIFEITETAVIDNFDKALKVIDKINNMGFSFALDDFGIGFSNFKTLKSLNVEYVKIDGSFIKNLVNSPKDKTIVKAINDMSQAFQQKTIAEFVEDEDIFKLLNELNVDYAQGYFIAKPLSFSETFLKK